MKKALVLALGLVVSAFILTGCGKDETAEVGNSTESKNFVGIYESKESEHSGETLELKADGTFALKGYHEDDTGKGTYQILQKEGKGLRLDFDTSNSFKGRYNEKESITCFGTLEKETIQVDLPDEEKRSFTKKD